MIKPLSTEHELLVYISQVTVRFQIIYSAVLCAVIATVVSLPFIYVDVSVQADGLVRPIIERSQVKSQVSGIIASLWVRDNESVKAGQTLLRLQTGLLDTKLRLLMSQQVQKQKAIHDLKILTSLSGETLLSVTNLESALFQQQYEQFRYVLQENLQIKQKRRRELDLNRQLYDDKVIPRLEFEDKKFAYETITAHHKTLIEQQRSEWQASLTESHLELTELIAQERQLKHEKALYIIKASVSGTITGLAGHYTGNYIQAGEVIGAISPDSTLLVECYVSPKDIGLLRSGQQARFEIDAFNYNQWGLLEGQVYDVGNDFTLPDNEGSQPVFKVRCRLNQSYLSLKNGYRGYLKKGMTARVRFVVARRSLFHLLYDKADDWFNPVVRSED